MPSFEKAGNYDAPELSAIRTFRSTHVAVLDRNFVVICANDLDFVDFLEIQDIEK